MKRVLSFLAIVSVMSMVLVGCSGGGDAAAEGEKPAAEAGAESK